MQRLQNPRDGQEQEDYEENYLGCRVLKIHSVILHLGFPCICPRGSPARRAVSYTQMGTKGKDLSLPWKLSMPCRFTWFNIKHHNWAHFPPVPCGI